jgi:hypothetical protein
MRKILFLCGLTLAFMAFTANAALAQQANRGRAVPSKSQRAWLVKDRLYVEVVVPNAIDPDPNSDPSKPPSYPYGEHFGNRLGDVIPFRVRIFAVHPADESHMPVKLDFAPLKAGRLTFDPDPENDPDWVLADKAVLGAGELPLVLPEAPQVVTIRTPDGRERTADLWDLKLFAQTKRQPNPMQFWLEFAYATQVTPNGTIDWQVATTPDFIVSQSRTSDNGTDLCMGNTSTINQNPPRVLALALCAGGLLLVLIPLGTVIVRKARPVLLREVQLDPAELFWKAVGPVLAAAKVEDGYNFKVEQVAVLVKSLKDFYGIAGGVAQLKERQFAIDDGEEVYKVLYSLEHGVLENGARLKPADYGRIVSRIERLVPRP